MVIGAGPSGTVAAAMLKKLGVDVRVVEKQKFPRFVIGESLIPRCMDHFEEAGLLDALKAEGFEKKHGARFIRGDERCVFDFSEQHTEGWAWTWQVPRARFDNVLAEEVQRKGVPIDFETGVTNIEFGSDKQRVTLDSGEVVNAKFIIDSSGYGRVIPRMLNLDVPSTLPVRSALFAHVQDSNRPAPPDGTMITFVILETDVWYWIIPFSDGTTSLGFVGPPEYFEKVSGSPEEKIRQLVAQEPTYCDRFNDTSMVEEARMITAYSSGVSQLYGEGYALTGNSAEFLDPVFSSGVSFATESGILAAKLAARQLGGENVDWQSEYADYINAGVDTFRSYVEAWYNGDLQTVFFSDQNNDQIKKQICSVLAGYVWDQTNPFVKKHDRAVKNLARVLAL